MSSFTSSVIPVSQFIAYQFAGLDLQRDINESHCIALQQFYLSKDNRTRLVQYTPVFIGIYNGARYLLDGQHRYTALRALRDIIQPDDLIEVRQFTCDTKEEMEYHFRNINSSNPLPSYFVTMDIEKDIKEALRTHIKSTYADFVKNTEKPHSPNFNLDRVIGRFDMDAIRNWFAVRNLPVTVEGVIDRFKWGNQACVVYLRANKEKTDVEKGYLAMMSRENKVCLGFNINWFEVMFYDSEPKMIKRQVVPMSLRSMLWRQHREKYGRVCCCACDKPIEDTTDGECGHKRSVVNGGKTVIENLVPICATCNKSCGTKDLDVFLASLGRTKSQ
jgi:hypothetical protein